MWRPEPLRPTPDRGRQGKGHGAPRPEERAWGAAESEDLSDRPMAALNTVSSPDTDTRTSPGKPGISAAASRSRADSSAIQLVRHARLPVLLMLRTGKLQRLLDDNSSWARQRSHAALMRMLLGSCCVVSAWQGSSLVGFGRATSDGVFRAVLWDVVIAADYQGQGLGRRIVKALINNPAVAAAERIYLMTSNSSGFYERLGFQQNHKQQLMVLTRND